MRFTAGENNPLVILLSFADRVSQVGASDARSTTELWELAKPSWSPSPRREELVLDAGGKERLPERRPQR